MSRSDSSFGIWNYVQTIKGTSSTPLLSPSSSGVNPSFPSPLFPLSTTAFPVGVFIGPPTNSNAIVDGRPFEVSLSANISGTTTTNVLVSLFNATQASWKDGPYASSYTLGSLGSGCTNVVTGTATSGITASASINVNLKAQFVWSSATGILGFNKAEQFINGFVVPISGTASVPGLSLPDLNFIPQFTFSGGGINTVNLIEFVINRI